MERKLTSKSWQRVNEQLIKVSASQSNYSFQKSEKTLQGAGLSKS